MALDFHFHPLASFCHKVLIALYENEIPFEPIIVDLGDAGSRAAFAALWPMAKMPVLHDRARGVVLPETTIIIEYLDQHYPGPVRMIPEDPDLARRARLMDRIFDCYVQEPMQKIVTDHLRPKGGNDPHGVTQARAQLRTVYDMLETTAKDSTWAAGEAFTLADCAAAPALFYAEKVEPFSETHPALAAYYRRLEARPSFRRVLDEAQPYFDMFPA